jgi:hypothetical protein
MLQLLVRSFFSPRFYLETKGELVVGEKSRTALVGDEARV